MRSIEDIAAIINSYHIAKVIPSKSRILSREEISKKASNCQNPETRKAYCDALESGKCVTRTISAKIEIDRDSLRKLEEHIRRELSIREVLFFADYLHGGDFTSSSGKWRRNSSGYVTQTHQEDSALTRLWSALVRSAYLYIGAASVLKMQDARLLAGYAFADEGDGPTLYDFTLDQLVRAVPKEYRKQLGAALKLDAILSASADMRAQGDRIEAQGAKLKKDVAAVGQGVGVLVQHLPDAKAPPHIEEVEAVAIMKRKGCDITDRTLRNWLKTGVAGRVKYPISWADLATVASWSAWVDSYLAAEKKRLTRKSFISEHAGEVEAEKSRRRSPTA